MERAKRDIGNGKGGEEFPKLSGVAKRGCGFAQALPNSGERIDIRLDGMLELELSWAICHM